MILSKEQFIKVINRLKKVYEYSERLEDVNDDIKRGLGMDFISSWGLMHVLEDSLISTLCSMFDDTEDSVLEYWTYDLSLGKDYEGRCYYVNDKPVDISTPEKLYDHLVERMNIK